ncbi:transketolase [Rickettsiales bacterium]|nr:transketolase [Rickettsiales bacterium]
MNHKQLIIEQSKQAGVGHIGSALSIIDILSVLYEKIINIEDLESNQRDRFILSKGHAALALYVTLHIKGLITKQELDSYCQNDSKLGVHPEHFVKGIDFATGSLGQGVTFATGSALAAKIEKSSRMIYCLLSDAELNEGSFWETILFASHHKLSNLVFILDNNGQQALGFTKDVINIENIGQKMSGFGFNTYTIDGHNHQEIETCLNNIKDSSLQSDNSKPNFIVANTICGKDVSYMENTIEWHYKSMNDDQYNQALTELNAK